MSSSTRTTFKCDNCKTEAKGEYRPATDTNDSSYTGRPVGWTRMETYGDLCDLCYSAAKNAVIAAEMIALERRKREVRGD